MSQLAKLLGSSTRAKIIETLAQRKERLSDYLRKLKELLEKKTR